MWKYFNKNISIYPILVCYLFFFACANPVSPVGGPKDEEPPLIVEDKSSENMQTNFDDRSFEFTFNEWVKLNDAFNQIVISPPLEHKPKVSLKKKTVLFEFDSKEELRKDATYVINFGKAVQDFNEGLPAENLRFVFSTGDYIDSLSVKGKVVDAFSGDAVEDVVILLYDNLADSVVRTERPFYFGRTDERGTFKIDNVRADTFKVFALVDKNFNYLFDLATEQIAYQEEPFILTDSTKVNLQLELFQEEQALRVASKKLDSYGKATLVFNKAPDDDLVLTYDSVFQKQQVVYEKDSIHFWYQPKDSIAWSMYLQQDTLLYDTVKVKAGSLSSFLAKAKLKLNEKAQASLENHNRKKPIELTFNRPLVALDTTAFLLLEDTLEIKVSPSLALVSDTVGLVKLRYDFVEDKPYKLLLLPGAVTDWYDLKNDSTLLEFTIPSLETFGNIIVNMTNLEEEMSYVIQLFQGKEMIDETRFKTDSIYTKRYNWMNPGTYEMRVIEDKNGNGRWDPGNYDMKTQSENLYFRPLGELRANWDLEVDFSVSGRAEADKPTKEEATGNKEGIEEEDSPKEKEDKE